MSTEKVATKVQFGEPPPARGAPYDWADVAKQLKRRPGKWALIFTDDRTTFVSAIRNGGIVALRPSSGFRVRTENNKRGTPRTCDLWMTYDPEHDSAKKAGE